MPRDRKANLLFRRAILRRCRKSKAFRAAVLKMCAADFTFWVDVFVWQFNPKEIMREVGPFLTHDFQRDAVRLTLDRLFGDQRRVIWEKSRYLGATWLALLVFVWASLFHPWKKFLMISHSEQAVYRPGDMDTLFGKIEFILQHLPDWMTRGAKKRKLVYTFPATHSAITGSATTERSGVGGRATAVLLDEFSKHTKDREIEGQMADTGPCLIISTHYGTGTAFYSMCQNPDAFKLVLHWSHNPDMARGLYRVVEGKVEVLDKSYQFPADYGFVTDGSPTGGPHPGVRSVWYDAECRERANARNVALHLDIDPMGSVSQFFDPIIVHQLVARYALEPFWVGDLAYDRETGEPGILIPTQSGPIKLWREPLHSGRFLGDFAAGADLSSGSGATPSCLSIADAATAEKVLEFTHAFLGPEQFAVFSLAVLRLFQRVLFAWEMQGPGIKFGQTIMDLRPEMLRVYYKTDDFEMKTTTSETPGWMPNATTKRILLEDYRTALIKGEFVNRSEQALRECLAFRYGPRGDPVHGKEAAGDGDPSAARVNHADRAIADALACKMVQEIGLLHARPKKQDPGPPVGSLAWRRELVSRRRQVHEVWQ